MKDGVNIHSRNRLSDRADRDGDRRIVLLLSLFFCVGSILGTTVAQRFPSAFSVRFPFVTTDSSFLRILWRYSWPCLLLLFLASSYAGSFFLTAVFFIRGFLFSACVYFLLLSGAVFSSVFLEIGLAALLTVPAFFLLGEGAFGSARRLFRLCSGEAPEEGVRFPVVRLCVSVLLLT